MSQKRVAILATGDEIITGQILNSNAQGIAAELFANDIKPGKQLTVSDDEAEITAAIQYLLNDHDAVVTIGGLGPTIDDRTRFAVAKAFDRKLIFHQDWWHDIEARLSKYNLPVTENNRIQAELPEGCDIIWNYNGTAAGCHLEANGKHLFMLPGPPNECLPMVNEHIIKPLQTSGFSKIYYKHSWLLYAVSESQVSHRLSALFNDDVILGYRVSTPYLEVKIASSDANTLDPVIATFNPLLAPNTISHSNQKASTQLRDALLHKQITVTITDHATMGHLEGLLHQPDTHHLFDTDAALRIHLTGLDRYWHGEELTTDQVKLRVLYQGKVNHLTVDVRVRADKTPNIASEGVAIELMKFLDIPFK